MFDLGINCHDEECGGFSQNRLMDLEAWLGSHLSNDGIMTRAADISEASKFYETRVVLMLDLWWQ